MAARNKQFELLITGLGNRADESSPVAQESIRAHNIQLTSLPDNQAVTARVSPEFNTPSHTRSTINMLDAAKPNYIQLSNKFQILQDNAGCDIPLSENIPQQQPQIPAKQATVPMKFPSNLKRPSAHVNIAPENDHLVDNIRQIRQSKAAN